MSFSILECPKFFTSYVHAVFDLWGLACLANPSKESESWYIRLVSRAYPTLCGLNIRISEHPPVCPGSRFDVDVSGLLPRPGAITFHKLLRDLALKTGNPLPPLPRVYLVHPGAPKYCVKNTKTGEKTMLKEVPKLRIPLM
ncbi:hypothetical protein FACS1894140_0360 [Spirochaetia bacterium]|nr:hypothetical protein FACS1894140_0360 [Spirochaetia bacterium]